MQLTERQSKLLDFVKISHGEQKRKYTGAPYWTHCVNVAKLVNEYDQTAGLIEIALCHDLFEDTDVDRKKLTVALKECGYIMLEILFINNGVEALTDVYTHESFPEYNRQNRKSFESNRLGKIGKDFQTVKYADLIDNTDSIVIYDMGFARKYVPEKREILNKMRMGNIELLIKCYERLLIAEERIKYS